MTTITQKKKLSKGTWALIFIVIAAVIAVAVLAVVGYISLTFLTDALVSIMMLGAGSWMSAIIVLATPFAIGIALAYVVQKYFIGNKVTNPGLAAGGYSPMPSYPTASQKDTETTVS